MTLAVKYRPINFNEVIGQDIIVRILINQLKNNTHKNAYLFTGASGCGKTTCAKIFAEQLNGGPEGIKIIDAASNNYKENILSIIEDCKNIPLFSKYKIYILDEVHLFSSNGWSSLLELLENTPEHVKIIMCTTEPNKIFHTVFSRVLRFNFKRIGSEEIRSNLTKIAKTEYPQINIDSAALIYMCQLANGSMREAISNLEFCVGYVKEGSNWLKLEEVIDIFGRAHYLTFLSLIYDVVHADTKGVLKAITKVFESGADLKLFIDDMIDIIYSIIAIKYKYYPSDLSIPEDVDLDIFEYEDMQKMMRILIKIKADIRYNNNPKNTIIASLINY